MLSNRRHPELNLSTCQDCQKEPAIYGDGSSWARCAKCQYQATKDDPVPPEPSIPTGEGFEHKTIPGLTSIIIPVHMKDYSLFHLTGNCLGSVREHTDKEKDPYEIIIVDNGSPVQPPSLQSYYADKVIKWGENKGVTKAWNAGVRCASGEYIVLLNNDTQVYDGWLATMKFALAEGLDLVMAKPMYSLTEPFARAVEAKREQDRWAGKLVTDSFDFDFKDFACVMFKKSLYDEVGAFDEQFFAYASDSDYFKRLDHLGKKYACCKAVPIHHIIDATGHSMGVAEIMNQDKAKFAEKWDPKTEIRAVEPAEDVGQASKADSAPLVQVPLVRVQDGGDPVYLLKGDHAHWITTKEVLEELGYSLGQVGSIPKEEFAKFTRGENISSFNIERFK